MVIITVPSDGGDQATNCLPLEYLNGWLFGVDVSRVDPRLKDTLIQYKKECYQILADYWHQGKAAKPRKHSKIERLSSEQCVIIKGMIRDRVAELPYPNQSKGATKCWSALKSKFGCTYKDIPPSEFPEAVSLIARLTLEGERLPNAQDYPELEQQTALYAQPVLALEQHDQHHLPGNSVNNLLSQLRDQLPEAETYLADQVEQALLRG